MGLGPIRVAALVALGAGRVWGADPNALEVAYPPGPDREAARVACASPDATATARCVVGRLLARDLRAAALALDLLDRHGHVVGVEEEHVMDGGFRGAIRIVPALPVGKHRVHLAWVRDALDELDAFLRALSTRATAPLAYQWRALSLRFFRSVGRRTPSAYAGGWEIAYNVSGSLNVSPDAVRELLFHELFHLNDARHAHWSSRVLGATHARLVATCGTDRACLAPYAPGDVTVKGGTWYAFQPGGGPGEYGAELALRYHQEHRAILAGKRPRRPFKCGPAENAASWEALAREFFGGVDLVPACR